MLSVLMQWNHKCIIYHLIASEKIHENVTIMTLALGSTIKAKAR